MVLDHHHRDVVQFDAVWHGQQCPMHCAQRARQVVHHPVSAIADAGLRQQIGRLQRLGQSRREPAHDVVAGRRAQRTDGVADHRTLILHQMRGDLAEAMAHELPSRVACCLRHARIRRRHGAIDRHRRRDAMRIERRLQPPEPDAHAVFVPCPVGQIGDHRGTLWRRQHLSRHRARYVPRLDIDHDEHRDALAVRQRQTRPVDARLIVEAAGWGG
jgi:hypothetical protein